MAISTNGTVLTRLAGALYNTQMSNATYKEVAALDPSALANVLYARDFSASTDAAVATTLVKNLGLASVTGLDNWVAAQLTSAGSAKGAKVVELLNSFAQMTTDTTYGAYATAFNTKIDAALALSQTTDNAGGTFEAAGVIGGKTFTLTTGVDNGAAFTGGVANDTFTATNLTFNATDIIDGGAGTADSLTITNNGTAALTLPGVAVTNIETVNIRNMAATGATTGSDEKATVTFNALVEGQTVDMAGLVFRAGPAGATAAQVAAAFAGGVADSTDAGNAIGATIAGTISGYTAAVGPTSNSVVLTSSSAKTNVSNLAITGSAQAVTPQVSSLTVSTGALNNVDNTFSFKVNGLSMTTATAGALNATGVATLAASIANVINSALGREVAKTDGTNIVSIVSDSPVTISDITAGGTGPTNTLTPALAPTKQTITWATIPGATTAWTFYLNGTQYSTATLAADGVDSGRNALVTRINEVAGFTVATASSTDAVVLDFQGKGFVLSKIVDGNSTPTLSSTTLSRGYVAGSPATATIVDGVADVTATTYATTFDARKFVGATSFNSDLSTSAVIVTDVAKDQTVGLKGNGVVATAGLDATYGSTVVSPTVNLTGGTNGGAVALTANAATTVTLNSSGAPLTSTGLTGTNTVASLNIGGTSSSTLNIVASSNLSTGTGSVTLAAKTLNVSGAATSVVLDSDTALTANSLTTINASGLSAGGVTLGLVAGITSFKGGAGADVITTNAMTTIVPGAIDGGEGTADILVVSNAGHVDTPTEAAVFTGFEILRNSGTTDIDVALLPTITSVQLNGADAGAVNLTAAQATNIGIRATNASNAIALATATGTADVLGVTLASSTAATAVDFTGATITGFETLNVVSSSGSQAGGTGTGNDLAFTAAGNLTAINVSGAYDLTIAAANVTKAVTVTSTQSGTAALYVSGNFAVGSSVTGSGGADAFILGNVGTTYNSGAGNDSMSATQAQINTGAVYSPLNAGDGTDTLNFTVGGAITITDNVLSKVTGFEKFVIATTTTNNQSIVTGGFFDSAFKATGIDLTTTSTDGTVTVDMTSFSGNVTLTATTAAATANTALGVIDIQTGAGADVISVTAGSNGGTGLVSTFDGNDTITTAGTEAFTLTGGKGNDTYNLGSSGVNTIVFADTLALYGFDTITSFLKTADIINWVKGDTETAVTGGLTTSADDIYQLGGLSAGKADSVAQVAAAMNAGATWVAATATAWIAISDDNSTAIYEWKDVAGTNGVQESEITLVGTIDAAMSSAELATAITIA